MQDVDEQFDLDVMNIISHAALNIMRVPIPIIQQRSQVTSNWECNQIHPTLILVSIDTNLPQLHQWFTEMIVYLYIQPATDQVF